MPTDIHSQAEALFQQALALHSASRLHEAQTYYAKVLQLAPQHLQAFHLLGIVALQTNQPQRALTILRGVVTALPQSAAAQNDLGNAQFQLGQFASAICSYEQAIGLNPDYFEAQFNRANALLEMKHYEEAVRGFNIAIAISPDNPAAYVNRGNALRELKDGHGAVTSYDAAIALNPRHFGAHNNRGAACHDLQQFEEAKASFRKAIELIPEYAGAHFNLGRTYRDLGLFDDAAASLSRAIALDPNYPNAYVEYANILYRIKRHDAAVASIDRAIALGAEDASIHGLRLHCKMQSCDWRDADTELAQLFVRIEDGEAAVNPFALLGLCGSPRLQRKAAENWARNQGYAIPSVAIMPKHARHDKIRVGYFSADFYDHAIGNLVVELFETHDRSQLEVVAVSLGPDIRDVVGDRIKRAADRFIDAHKMSDRGIVDLCRQMELDIAVDLGGYSGVSRPNLFALRVAPIQVSYLGYVGTMGAQFMDYLLAEAMIVPPESRCHYSEKIAYLPRYQVNPSMRRTAGRVFTRAELGLPSAGFVFCCFNNDYKLSPEIFDSWMRILRKAEDSTLFLLAETELVKDNLRREAIRRGIDSERMVFGGRLEFADYMARYRAPDLFLDTLPFNAGTTASDALWAGLPVLTCTGEAFAGRVAASILGSLGLAELVASTPQQYEERAVELARNPQELSHIRQKLADARCSSPVFEPRAFARDLEGTFTAMYERYCGDLPPEHLYPP